MRLDQRDLFVEGFDLVFKLDDFGLERGPLFTGIDKVVARLDAAELENEVAGAHHQRRNYDAHDNACAAALLHGW